MDIFELINNTLINYLHNRDEYNNGHYKTNIFLFSIGSYPYNPELSHENPIICKNLENDKRFKIIRILIDSAYLQNTIGTMKMYLLFLKI